MPEARLRQLMTEAVAASQQAGELPAGVVCPPIEFETPKSDAHGDLATNLAMTLARAAKLPPRKIADALVAHFPKDPAVDRVEVAGPGFINFHIAPAWYIAQLPDIAKSAGAYGTLPANGKRCLVEFVSANPTGPLHVGHGRNAILGDALANLMRAAGYAVTKEYYLNDAGVQMQTLGRSVVLRLRELSGEMVEFPADCYQGEYIRAIARRVLADTRWAGLHAQPAEAQYLWCGRFAGEQIFDEIKQDLAACGVTHDTYFCETTLHESGAIDTALQQLQQAGHLYEQDGALWFRSTTFGDDKDRVVRKADGALTYFAADIAYHAQKFAAYDCGINVLGADHAGYVPRLKAVVAALGHDPASLHCILTQLVNLVRDGELVSMSTRRAEYETLAELVRLVGKDVARYFFLMRSHNTQLDFDLQLATARSMDNPVYYIQYAHARICSIFAKAAEAGQPFDATCVPDAVGLACPEEAGLAKWLCEYPKVVALAARELEPHRVTYYVLELARKFQSYYTMGKKDAQYRVLGHPAKLYLLHCIRIVLRNALGLLGLSAPDRMDREAGEDE